MSRPSLTRPLGGLRLRDLLYRNADLYGDERAVVFAGRSLTWAELTERVARLANRLAAEGIGRGSRIAVLQRNGPEVIEIFQAAAMLGATVVPVSQRLTASEAGYIVDDAAVGFAFVEADHPAGGAFAEIPTIPTRTGRGYDDFVSEGDSCEPPSAETPDDPMLLLYTSGTTGRPKGAVLTQAAMIQNGLTTQLSQRLTHDDVFLTTTPLTHAAAGTRVFSLAVDGITHVILERFTVEGFLAAVEEYRVTTTILVPTMLRDVVEHEAFDPARLASLRTVLYGAAPTPADLVERALEAIPCGIVHAYGLTEGCPALTIMTADEHRRFRDTPGLRHRLASIGRPVTGVRVQVVGEDGRRVKANEIGELLVRSTKAMVGYWNRPEETAAVDVDGWLATGDVGYQDEDGYLFLVDRKHDMLISGGLNVYPSEIERVLRSAHGVRDAAVVGVPHGRWGEVPVAFVVPATPGGDPSAAAGRACRDQLAGYKQPKAILAVDALPRNETGKVTKAVLQEWARRSVPVEEVPA
jgi:acyl-CoA synthetase (AMP-forming)/AMP-acid ligase II